MKHEIFLKSIKEESRFSWLCWFVSVLNNLFYPFPPPLAGAAGTMGDPLQMMAALQGQLPTGAGPNMPDMKALAAAGMPMFPFFGGMPGELYGEYEWIY